MESPKAASITRINDVGNRINMKNLTMVMCSAHHISGLYKLASPYLYCLGIWVTSHGMNELTASHFSGPIQLNSYSFS